MLLRWSIWGRCVERDVAMLQDSIRSFRHHLGAGVDYLVHTDAPEILRPQIKGLAEVREYGHHADRRFASFGAATWAKWCPSARLAPGDVEIHVDSDVFLLRRPTEIVEFSSRYPADGFLALQEDTGAAWQRGVFAEAVPQQIPFINAGFFVQGPEANISDALEAQFAAWLDKVEFGGETFHDEQGALAMALVAPQRHGRLSLLDRNRYVIVSPRSNPELSDLSAVVLLHATHPGHPAYHRFRDLLPHHAGSP